LQKLPPRDGRVEVGDDTPVVRRPKEIDALLATVALAERDSGTPAEAGVTGPCGEHVRAAGNGRIGPGQERTAGQKAS
jgi:hypothetical protein